MHNHSHSHHSHGHHHGHSHNHGHQATQRVLFIAIALAFGFALIEAICGWLAHSLALLSDAAHMAADALSLVLAAVAAWFASKPPSASHSYGLGRAEVLGAWISSLLIVLISIAIAIEAFERLEHLSKPVSGLTIIYVACVGVLVNLLIAWVLSRSESNLNIKAAILHVLGDLLGSVAALLAGIVIYFTGWLPIDPILSIFIAVLILISSIRLLRETLLILMEGVPPHLDLAEVGRRMAEVEGVLSVHDLHIWTLSSGMIVLTAHIQIEELTDWDGIYHHLQALIKQQFNIEHITLQPESNTQVLKPLPLSARASPS